MMNEPKDKKYTEGDENKNRSLGKKNKITSCRRKKRKAKSKTGSVAGSTANKFIDVENQIKDIFFESFFEQKLTFKNVSNATTSIKIQKSVSGNLKEVDPTSKNCSHYFLSNFRLDEPISKITNLNMLNNVQKYCKNINKPDSMNYVNEVNQNLFKAAKKKKKKCKKVNKEAIKCKNGPDVEESTSKTGNNNSQVLAENTVKANMSKKSKKKKKSKKSKKLISEDGKCGYDRVYGSNNQNPHVLVYKKTSDNGEAQKKSNSESGKHKKIAKGNDSKRFMDNFLPKEIEHLHQLGLLYSGVIRINQKNFTQAYIPPLDKGMDILVDGLSDRNTALEGDEVYYTIKDPSHHEMNHEHNEVQKTAVVVAIKKMHHNRTAVGTLLEPQKNSNTTTFMPRDIRIPWIHIHKKSWPPGFEENPQLFKNKLYLAKIMNWANFDTADGAILKEIGVVGDIDSETSAIMLMFQLIETPYSNALIKTIPRDGATFSSPEMKKRKDLRTECIFTIDPVTAKDLDDAVSCRLLPNGNYLIGVHISDVTYYLEEGSSLDGAASMRATTVYLVQKVYHMLPIELCELCSLTPGTDKLTFSVLMELTPEAEVVQCDFKKSVINCCGQFSYEQVQDIIEKSESTSFPILFGPHRRKNVVEAITVLNSLAIKLREKRFSNGALKIDQTKISFSLNEKGLPESYSVYVNKESHRLIEEFMLLANMKVAKRISQEFPKIAFLRSHPPPSSFMLKRVKEKLKRYSIDLDISSSKSLNTSLVRYSGDDPVSESRMAVLNVLLAKTMNRANYYCAEFRKEEIDRRHYALNVELYTHFTSPIRRYADILVHRLLAASLGYIKKPNWHPDHIKRIAELCNEKKYAAKLAGEKSTVFFLTIYIEKRGPIVYEAVVFDIKDKSFDYIILDNGLQQRLYFQNLEGKATVENIDGTLRVVIHWPETDKEEKWTQVINIFSTIKIQLKKSSTQNKLESKLMRY